MDRRNPPDPAIRAIAPPRGVGTAGGIPRGPVVDKIDVADMAATTRILAGPFRRPAGPSGRTPRLGEGNCEGLMKIGLVPSRACYRHRGIDGHSGRIGLVPSPRRRSEPGAHRPSRFNHHLSDASVLAAGFCVRACARRPGSSVPWRTGHVGRASRCCHLQGSSNLDYDVPLSSCK